MAIEISPYFAVHPGRWLYEEIVEPSGLTVTALAGHLSVSRQAISALLNGRAGLTAEMAIRFEKAFGLKADTLCRMQTAYELAEAREHEADIDVRRIGLAA
ncbi:Antitoxin HigA [hydrothermal vent metagenome]|uniref:Antitoxin HigA n=1 Tax=hydrothermal vent metagenome TaxID=652676 RepID=A0A3B0RMM2_9ZZZZ